MPEPLSQARFRHVMGHFASGVTVMTTSFQDQLHGMTVSAFCSVSLQPLLVLVSVERVTRMYELVSQSQAYAVNILQAKDEEVSRFFADDARLLGDEFAALAYRRGVTGSPILQRATAYLEARVRATYDGGDHVLFLGEALALEVLSESPPLIFYRGGYTTIKTG